MRKSRRRGPDIRPLPLLSLASCPRLETQDTRNPSANLANRGRHYEEAFEDFLDIELGVMGVERAEGDVLQVEEHRHG